MLQKCKTHYIFIIIINTVHYYYTLPLPLLCFITFFLNHRGKKQLLQSNSIFKPVSQEIPLFISTSSESVSKERGDFSISCGCLVTSVMSDSVQPYGLQPARLLCPWILQSGVLERVAMPSSRGSSQPRDRTSISQVSRIGRWILYQQHHLGIPFNLQLHLIDQSIITKSNQLALSLISIKHHSTMPASKTFFPQISWQGSERPCKRGGSALLHYI